MTATHKHVTLIKDIVQMLPDDDGNLREVLAHHEAQTDVPLTDLDAFLADAATRWPSIETGYCPPSCPAQLAPPEGDPS